MTHEELLQAVTDKLVKAVPEIRELKFGCVVETGINAGSFAIFSMGGKYRQFTMTGRCLPPSEHLCVFNQKIGSCTVSETEIAACHKIIGRPITLEDVLRALGGSRYAVSTHGRFYELFGGGKFQPLKKKWLLHKPLSEQSEETLQFLDSLLE